MNTPTVADVKRVIKEKRQYFKDAHWRLTISWILATSAIIMPIVMVSVVRVASHYQNYPVRDFTNNLWWIVAPLSVICGIQGLVLMPRKPKKEGQKRARREMSFPFSFGLFTLYMLIIAATVLFILFLIMMYGPGG